MMEHIRWQDLMTLLAGAWLMLTHMLGITSVSIPSGAVAYLIGATVAIMSGASMARPDDDLYSWTNTILGVGLLAAPFLLGLTAHPTAMLQFLLVGAVVTASSALALLQPRELDRPFT
jgi:hypothetical protein